MAAEVRDVDLTRLSKSTLAQQAVGRHDSWFSSTYAEAAAAVGLRT